MKRCKRCGRRIKDESIDYGPVCAKKRQKGFKYQFELNFNPAIDRSLNMKEQHERVKKLLEVR
jgi:hypothetical protein